VVEDAEPFDHPAVFALCLRYPVAASRAAGKVRLHVGGRQGRQLIVQDPLDLLVSQMHFYSS
jgi:hypothetical protein